MTQQQTSQYTGRPIVDWLDHRITLRDVDGDKVGDVVEVNPDFLIAETDGGFLGLGEHELYYVPRQYVAREDTEDWFLSITKDQARDLDWREAPAQSSYTGGDWRAEYDADTSVRDGDTGRTRLVTHEEELQARAVPQQVGEVGVRKEVVEETRTIEVPVRREEVVIERRPVGADTTDTGSIGAAGETIRVPVMEEQIEVTKVVRPVEEVEVSKRVIEDTRTVSDTVRREELRVDDDAERVVEDRTKA
jgi:uncharacterized protein (TIGR02271 family)